MGAQSIAEKAGCLADAATRKNAFLTSGMQPAANSWSFEEDDLNAIVRTITRFLAETGARVLLVIVRDSWLLPWGTA